MSVPRRPIPLVSYSVRLGLHWLVVEASSELAAVTRAVHILVLPSYAVPDDIRATEDELRRFAALRSASRPAGSPRRRDVRNTTGRRHVDPGTGPLFDEAGP